MLAFLKRWRQAYLEDKGNRLYAEVEESLDILNKYNVLEPEKCYHVCPRLRKRM
jgi:hypothetical protein